jgi:enoyl-CoA hydratase/carnithine racemase
MRVTAYPEENAGNEELHVDDDDGLRTLTLRRPQKLNALSLSLFDRLGEALTAAGLDTTVHCVVLTGMGRAFCVGTDLANFVIPLPQDGRRHDLDPLIDAFVQCDKPIIAAVNGLAVGLGVTLLGHCDIVLASTAARFQLPFVQLGITPEAGSTATLQMSVGPQEAAHLVFTGEWIDAVHAKRVGLVWETAEPEDLENAARDLGRRIASQPLEALMATKKLLRAARAEAVSSAREREGAGNVVLFASSAHHEAVAQRRKS